MKKIIHLLIFLVVAGSLQSQDLKMRIANKSFYRFQFEDAIKEYENIVKSSKYNIEAIEKLAISYDKIQDHKNAMKWYGVLMSTGNIQPRSVLAYAQNLAKNKLYSESALWYEKLKNIDPKDPRPEKFINAYKNMQIFYMDSALYKVAAVSFNCELADFSPAYYKNGLVFVSARSKWKPFQRTFQWDKTPYLDLYFYNNNKVVPFDKKLNTKYHEGPVTFTKDLNFIVFTRNNYYHSKFRTSHDKINKLKLYSSEYEETGFKNQLQLPFDNNNYSTGHPTFAPDYKKMYFISDMPGGFGGTDIYAAEFKDGVWGIPVNLGPEINTPGNEMFPYVDSDSTLFYASDGLPGLGGLDIFVAKPVGGVYKSPVNIGYPINSNKDDFGLIFDPANSTGYFSSNRCPKGDDNIYSFIKAKRKEIYLLVFDTQTHDVFLQAGVKSVDCLSNADSISTGITGVVKGVSIRPDCGYSFTGYKENYENNTIALSAGQLENTDTVKIGLTKIIPSFVKMDMLPSLLAFKGCVEDADQQIPIEGAKVIIKNKTSGAVREILSGPGGCVECPLDTNSDYFVRVEVITGGKQCQINSEEFTTRGLRGSQTIYRKFTLFCVGDIIKIENIYYDFDKYNIRPDAAVELNKLLDIMKRYPTMTIELRSHTDCRGNDLYNMKLSENRAKSAVLYLISRGINGKRMIAKGYGETLHVNKCSNGIPCTEPEHQLNRRTEFKILSLGGRDNSYVSNPSGPVNQPVPVKKDTITGERPVVIAPVKEPTTVNPPVKEQQPAVDTVKGEPSISAPVKEQQVSGEPSGGIQTGNKIIFTVQVASCMEDLHVSDFSSRVKKEKIVFHKSRTDEGRYFVYTGSYDHWVDALELRTHLIELGFKGAFVIALSDGKKIQMTDELKKR